MILTRSRKVELLHRAPLFARCSKAELDAIARIALEVHRAEGDVLVAEGDEARELCVIVAGTAEVRKGRRWLNALEEGDFFGEIALLAGGARTATVRATSPMTLLVVEGPSFVALLDRLPRVRGKLLQAMAERLVHDAI